MSRSVGRLTGELQTWVLSWSFHQPLLLCASRPAYFPVIAMVLIEPPDDTGKM